MTEETFSQADAETLLYMDKIRVNEDQVLARTDDCSIILSRQ